MNNNTWKQILLTILEILGFLGLVLLLMCSLKHAGQYLAGVDDTPYTVTQVVKKPIPQAPIIEIVEKEVPIYVYQKIYVEIPNETELTDAEIDLLAALVHAEAGNQDQVGKRLVADVVLNRMYSDDYPDTVEEVIYQKSQFATVPLLHKQIVTQSDYDAVYSELKCRLDTEIIFFQTHDFSPYGKDAYPHGDHYFSNAKED